MDKLAAEGLRFEHAYSTVAVCQPVRQTMFCGLYPHRSGSMGFFPVKPGVRTLNQQLRVAGYLISRFGKGRHLQPSDQFCSDIGDDTISRHPTKLAEAFAQRTNKDLVASVLDKVKMTYSGKTDAGRDGDVPR